MYPKTIVIKNEKLLKLLKEKEHFIMVGRGVSDEIEVLEIQMNEVDEQIQVAEKEVDTKDIADKAEELTKQLTALVEQMDGLKKERYERVKAVVSQDLITKYENLEKEKGNKETERNKLALKAQQKMDKIIPLTQKEMKPFLEDKYEDYDTIRIEAGEIVGTIFSHLEDFKTTFDKKVAKK